MKDLKTTNGLLLVIVIPLVFYLLKILSFIFIPLVFSMFIALLFLPIMRWLARRKVPKWLSILVVLIIISIGLKIGGELIGLSSKEILAADNQFFEKAESKVKLLFLNIEDVLGLEYPEGAGMIDQVFNQDALIKNLAPTIDIVGNTISMTLMTLFFTILWLGESINIQKLLDSSIIKQKHTSVRTFRKIEKDLITFVKVKFLVSLLTGIGFSLACYFFGVSFPIFWGLFAFVINFVQMIGSFVSVILLTLFAFVELDPTGTLLFFILTIIGVQALFGGVLEPVFMGKSFSINVITILVMLMLWGFIWGVPGLIMSIPITVFVKIILEQFDGTKPFAKLLEGSK